MGNINKAKDFRYSSLLGISAAGEKEAVDRMYEQIMRVGGTLHFIVEHATDGWSAQCSEYDGIMTGGSNPNPTDEEIQLQINDAIKTAFNISPKIKREVIRNEEAPAFKVLAHA